MFTSSAKTGNPGTATKIRRARRRMPWRGKPTKGAASCDKPGEAQTAFDPGIPEWGNPAGVMPCYPPPNKYGAARRQPGELKHLSTPRKGNQPRLRGSGERNRASPNPRTCKRAGVAAPGLRGNRGACSLGGCYKPAIWGNGMGRPAAAGEPRTRKVSGSGLRPEGAGT